MNLSPRRLIRLALGERRWRRARSFYAQIVGERRYTRQRTTRVSVEGIVLTVPRGHPLVVNRQDQPRRDVAVGLIAAGVEAKHGPTTMLDIGANVGDTAARIATGAQSSKLVLVEPSEYFCELLKRNLESVADRITLKQCLVGVEESGVLRHWGGTAIFESDAVGPSLDIPTRSLDELVPADCRFVKIDTDGYDFAIILRNSGWFAKNRPVLYYEVDCSTPDLLHRGLDAIDVLSQMGYNRFAVFDDPGDLLISTDRVEQVVELHEYLYVVRSAGDGRDRVSNFDLLATTESDAVIRDEVVRTSRALQLRSITG